MNHAALRYLIELIDAGDVRTNPEGWILAQQRALEPLSLEEQVSLSSYTLGEALGVIMLMQDEVSGARTYVEQLRDKMVLSLGIPDN
ncbi:MAG: hypothetical protein ACQEW8_10695 [Actinomycetota bacterium]